MEEAQISSSRKAATPSSTTQYTPPRIESVMKPEDLAREVQYAGSPDNTIGPPV